MIIYDLKKKARDGAFVHNKRRLGGLDMGGFFETYVDPLQEIIKQKEAALVEKDAMIAKLQAQLTNLA